MPVSASHTFLAGVDTDTGDSQLPANAARAMFNVAVERGYVTNAWGNEALPIDLPAGRCKTVGSFADADTGTEILFVWNSEDQHRLYRYAPATRVSTLLLEWAGLNLREDHYVTGGGIIADQLGYLDADGVPRLLSLTRAAAGEYTPALLAADPHALDLARRTPAYAPLLSRGLNDTASDTRASLRLTNGRAWQAAYRLAYLDSELTPLSPYSQVLESYPVSSDFPDTNYVRITIPAAERWGGLVDYVELYVRPDAGTVWRLAHTIRRDAMGELAHTYDYYGNLLGPGLSEPETIKQREAVPLRAAAMVAAKNHFMLANLEEGSNTPPTVDLRLRHAANYNSLTLPVVPTFLSGGVYTAGIQFYDHAGRTGGSITIAPFTVPFQAASATNPLTNFLYWELFATAPDALNREIPAEAQTWGLVLSKDQSRSFFLKFRAADVLVFTGLYWEDGTTPKLKHISTYGGQSLAFSASVSAGLWASLTTRLFIDIGNIPDSSGGQVGYTFVAGSGDRLRFLADGMDLPIKAQHGDFLEVVWTRATGPSSNVPLLEIYTPAFSSEEETLFENGPRYGVMRNVRAGVEYRSYGVSSGELVADCFLVQRPSMPIFMGSTLDYNLQTFDTFAYKLTKPLKKDYLTLLRLQADKKGFLQDNYQYSSTQADKILSEYNNFNVGLNVLSPSATEQLPLFIRVEAMSPDDAHYARWLHGRTRPTAARLLGQVRRAATLRVTGALVPGTRLNGLTTMDALNEKELAREQGACVALVLADQTHAEGTVLLALQERGGETFYLGQVQLAQATGQPLIAVTDQLLSPGNPLSRGLGTTHPASVAHYGGRAWYWDGLRNEVVRYDRNGVLGLAAQYKFVQRCRELATRFIGQPVVGYYDPAREEYLLTFGRPNNEELPSETIGFSEKAGGFIDHYGFMPEWGTGAGNQLLTFQGGVPHRHAPELPRNTFYGQRSASQITLVAGGESNEVEKTWTGVNQEATPLWVPLVLSNAAGQVSTMLRDWFTRNRTTWQGSIRRDQNTPGLPRARALHEGHKLQSPLLQVVLECDTDQPASLQQVSFNYAQNAGLPIAPTR